MTDEQRYIQIKQKCLFRVFSRLNDRQKQAVFAVKGPLLVLAGAGSGKTTVLVDRVYNVLNFGELSECDRPDIDHAAAAEKLECAYEGGNEDLVNALRSLAVRPASPDEVLCITFTNKAADEFKNRLANMLGERAEGIWAGTFHSVCVRILRRSINKLGFSNSFAIYDAEDSRKLIKQILKEKNIDEKYLPEKLCAAEISRFKERRVLPEEAQITARDGRDEQIASVYAEYQEKLKAASALDFDDLILDTLTLFEEFPEVEEYYANQFRYIFVDEYQDTNPSQNALVLALGKAHRNVCVVGDDDQSIYSFRGAAVENILNFDTSYPDARIIKLEQNYRSTGTILDAANAIIANNESRKGKTLWTRGARGDKIEVRCLYTQTEEAEYIKNKIEELQDKGEKLKDTAVLYRANALSRSIETALVKARIPYKVFGGIKYYERKEIKDIIAYLSLACNRADDLRLRRIINVPRRAIGDTTVDKIAELALAEGADMYTVIKTAAKRPELARACAKLESFYSVIEELAEYSASHGVAETVAYAIEITGYEDMLESGFETDRLQNLRDFVSAGALYEESAEEPTLEGFLADIALVSDVDSYDAEENAVSLMTVHSAKGLEFGNVFIAGFEQGVFPSQLSLDEGGAEEERRLAYVAVTRAKNRLFITYTQSRMLYGMTRPSTPSEFLDEIPPELKEFKSAPRYGHMAYGDADEEIPVRTGGTFDRGGRAAQDFVKVKTPSPAPNKALFCANERVEHAIFGKGTVESCEQMGSDALVTVAFDNGQVKKLMASFAKLKKI